MKRSFFARMWQSLGRMPEPAYIFLCAVFNLTLAMLFACYVALLLYLDGGQQNMHLFNLAMDLASTPAGVLLVGVLGLAVILDRTI